MSNEVDKSIDAYAALCDALDCFPTPMRTLPWRTDPCSYDDEDANGGWDQAVRNYEDRSTIG